MFCLWRWETASVCLCQACYEHRAQTKEITQVHDSSAVWNLWEMRSKLSNPGIMQTFNQLMRKVKVSEIWSHRSGFSWICQIMLPHYSAPVVGPAQVSFIWIRVIQLKFYSQRETATKELCLSTQLRWQNITSDATLQLAVLIWSGETSLQAWTLLLTWDHGIQGSFGKGKACSVKAGLADPEVSCLLFHSSLVYRRISQIISWQEQSVILLWILLVNTQNIQSSIWNLITRSP